MNEKELQRYLEDIINLIHLRITETDLTKKKAADLLIIEIAVLLEQFGVTLERVMPEAIAIEYFGGIDEASRRLIEAGVIEKATQAVTPSGGIAKPFRKGMHLEAVAELLDDTMLDLRAAVRTAQESAAVSITETLKGAQRDLAQGIIAGDPRKVIQARVAKTFQENGLTSFITSDGKRLPLDFYSMTVTRTKTREARVNGSVKRYEEFEQDLVRISGNADTCEVCARYQGMVVSLTGKTSGYPVAGEDIPLPAYHPNCRCGLIPFVESRKSAEEIAAAKARNAAYSPTTDRRTPAQRKAYEREQKARQRANAEKKQYARWQMVLGDQAPKSIGGFRRMKRQNTPKYQELSAEYRRILREDVK